MEADRLANRHVTGRKAQPEICLVFSFPSIFLALAVA
jgi:hypothetical protein